MTCTEARRAMRTADRLALRGEDDSAVAEHVRSCRDCQHVALEVEAGTELLAELVMSRGDAPVVALAERRPNVRRAAALALIPVAAAIAGVLVLRREAAPPVDTTRAAPRSSVSVEVAPGQTAAVLKTKDPNVTIVWLTRGASE
jgi:predicted anti-sigma-YlaC factor YlaD